jgi:hypothetical protein
LGVWTWVMVKNARYLLLRMVVLLKVILN